MKHMLSLLGALLLTALSLQAIDPKTLTGDYIEVRSNHVYTCGCLYSGEQVTGGREAILVWAVRDGLYHGVSLAGTRVVAVVQGPDNLSLETTVRHSVLYVDGAVSELQRLALVDMVREQYGKAVGEIVRVHAKPITFQRDGDRVRVRVAGTTHIVVRLARLPEDAHQGSLLWYEPFIPTSESRLATREYSSFSGPEFRRQWWTREEGITGYIATFGVPR